MRAGVIGAVLVDLPAYFLMWLDGVLVISGRLAVGGTIVAGLVLVIQKRTRRLGLGLLLGFLLTSVVAAVASFAVVLYIISTVDS